MPHTVAADDFLHFCSDCDEEFAPWEQKFVSLRVNRDSECYLVLLCVTCAAKNANAAKLDLEE